MERNVTRSLVGINLVLNELGNADPSSNLLSPTGSWHGLQPYMFDASDFLKGPDNSTLGARRTIEVKSKNLVVVINVLNVKLASTPDSDPQIDDLALELMVDNLKP